MRLPAWAAALASGAALAGCASLPPSAGDTLHAGRFALTAAHDGRTESSTGRFTLRARGSDLTLDLATPLGTTLARIESRPAGATLTAPAADGALATWRGPDATALTQQVFGWSFPLAGMTDWIVGRPAERAAQDRALVSTDANGLVNRITQDGWTIDIQDRFDGNGAPRRLRFERPATTGAPALTLRLVLDEPER